MSTTSWLVVLFSLAITLFGGFYKFHPSKTVKEYVLGKYPLKRTAVLFSVMATQASAITFISTPGQAYSSGIA